MPPSASATALPLVALSSVEVKLASAAGIVNILRGIDLAIGEGETVGIVGPSGSGKSTLLMVAAGLERPTAGRVAVGGVDFATLSEDGLARFRRQHVGIVFQSFQLIPTMSAVENVAIPLELGGRRDAFAEARAALDRVGLGHRLDHYPGQLSGGEQQRVALARAFVARPRLLLADEPTGNLDGATGQQVIELLFDLRRRAGTALVLVTHDTALADRTDRVVRLADGRIVSDERRPALARAG
ncbi:ABC transporter ATP-binding protein [Stella sp.]|jgi:putative ABC transport system ATP-binding protein|uniref:ABC transporter ATP-binding protein n=1 Tax=Stella sp. TaxID=2912054 RepID=UPI0035B40D0F